jgi:hypothetical protein
MLFGVVLDQWDYILIVVIAVFCTLKLAMYLKPETSRLSRIEMKLDHLLRHAGIKFDPLAFVPANVVEALKRGQTVEASKLYREATGVSPAEAFQFIEDLKRLSEKS